jgi:superfamily I DNA/RNA helicase
LKAIEYVTEKKNVQNIYFEGNINSYTYADDGTSLYDVMNLYTHETERIKDKLIKEMENIDELEEYIKKTEDVQLGMMLEIVREYGSKIPSIIRSIKEKHIKNDEKTSAEMIFSTVHRCKGMEYDSIQIVNDFINEEKLEKLLNEKKRGDLNFGKLNEEINLLYVAITRTKNRIQIPENLIPNNFPSSSQIQVIRGAKAFSKQEHTTPKSSFKENSHKENSWISSIEEIRMSHKDAYKPWTYSQDNELTLMYCEGVNVNDLAAHFGRTIGAIRWRIRKLELEELYG